MEKCTKPQTVRPGLCVSALVLSVSLAIGIQSVIPAEAQRPGSAAMAVPPNTTTTAPQKQGEKTLHSPAGAAVRVYTNPNTGEIIQPPAGAPTAETPESLEKAFSTSSQGLVETPSPVPGGGVMIDLQGRFRSPLVATQGADGKVSVEHTPGAPDSGEKK